MVNIVNVKGDGHCGFRAVASLMGFGEDEWARVRQDLMFELSHNVPMYEDAFRMKELVGEVMSHLNCFTETAGHSHWFMLPYMGILVASAYNVVFVALSPSMSISYLPLNSAVPTNPRCICMALINNNHFVQVF